MCNERGVFVYEEKRVISKFASKYKPFKYVTNEKGCWLCVSHRKDRIGYIRIMRSGKMIALHRYIYEAEVGYIPEGLIILHSCDNRHCFNPDHLSAGTHLDNSRDMVAKGRSTKGNRNGNSKLEAHQVRQILNDNRPLGVIAKIYGITSTTVCDIKKGRTWSHINNEEEAAE